MGVTASVFLLADAVSKAQNFIRVFAGVYTLILFAYIITSWVRLPYSTWLNRIQRFLYDVSEPYLRLFRRVLPSTGPIDLSPMIGVFVLIILGQVVNVILGKFH